MTSVERAPRRARRATPAAQTALRLGGGALTILVTLVAATLVLLAAFGITGESALHRRRP